MYVHLSRRKQVENWQSRPLWTDLTHHNDSPVRSQMNVQYETLRLKVFLEALLTSEQKLLN